MATSSTAKTFATLLRQSKFISLGDFRNSTVVGRVFHTTQSDLYVDVGLKFHAVVKKPQQDSKLYVRGSMVKLRLIDYEITDRFIGSDQEVSLLEADAILLGLESTPIGSKRSQQTAKKPQESIKQPHESIKQPHESTLQQTNPEDLEPSNK